MSWASPPSRGWYGRHLYPSPEQRQFRRTHGRDHYDAGGDLDERTSFCLSVRSHDGNGPQILGALSQKVLIGHAGDKIAYHLRRLVLFPVKI